MYLKHVPNAICILRLCMIPVLWYIAYLRARGWFVGALAFTWFTDAIDGHIARTYHVESKLGAVLDSIADNSVQLSMPFWLWMLVPELYVRYWYLVVIMLVLFIAGMALQWYRRAPLHTYANKFTAWVLAVFLLYTFAVGLSPVFMWITFFALVYAMGEGLLILMVKREVSENTRSLWR